MNNITEQIKAEITARHGKLERVGDGRSLFSIPAANAFVYFRYSKILGKARPYAFFGLRKQDVDLARGGNLYLCLVTDNPDDVFLIPFADFESCYDYTRVGGDDQYKTMIFFKEDGAELYIPQSARFNAEAYRDLDVLLAGPEVAHAPEIDHAGAQTLLGIIGSLKGHSIWHPKNDLDKIDLGLVGRSSVCRSLPSFGSTTDAILKEIDVIWLSGSRDRDFGSGTQHADLFRFVANQRHSHFVRKRGRCENCRGTGTAGRLSAASSTPDFPNTQTR